jgi:spectrin beta
MEVEDLFVDLADGVKLLKLLEIISGEKLGKPNNGRMRVHKIENLNKSLAFLHTKVSIFVECTLIFRFAELHVGFSRRGQ